MSPENEKTLLEAEEAIAKDLVAVIKRVAKEKDVESRIPDKKSFIESIEYKVVDGKLFIGSELVYAPVIEFGRLTGSHVPLEPLIKWLRYKKGLPEEEARRVAYVIEQKIFTEGIPPKKVFKVALNRYIEGVG